MAEEVRMSFVVFICLVGVTLGKDIVPVYIWSSSVQEVTPYSALKQLRSQDFADHLIQRLEYKPLVLVFTEENLSVEDFSDVQFQKLQTLGKSIEFLPSVQNPMRAIKKVVPKQSTLEDIPKRGSALVVIKLDDATPDENRGQLLKRHDARINEIYQRALGVRDDIVAVYTGYYTSWMEPEMLRVRRAADNDGPDSNYMNLTTQTIQVYARTMPFFKIGDKNGTLSPLTSTDDKRSNYQSLSAKMSSSAGGYMILKFLFYNTTSSYGYWSLTQINFTDTDGGKDKVLKPDSSIVVPYGFSYHCTAGITFKNEDGDELKFDNFQAEAYMEEMGVFDDAYNCELFFTAPIWSGLFVMTILAMIMIWGLVMIMDIRTMDQFDDPKGKTITINAVE